MRRQNPLEVVFEDISTFDAENPVVGSLLREIDINKNQSESDFIKSLPSHPGKEFEIQKRLDRLKGKNCNFKRNNNNNNNNFGSSGPNLFYIGAPPSLPTLEHFIDGGTRPPLPPQPPTGSTLFETQSKNNLFVSTPTFNLNNPEVRQPTNSTQPFIDSSLFDKKSNKNSFTTPFDLDDPIVRPSTNYAPPTGIGNNLFGSQAAETVRESKTKTKTQNNIDDFLYELPDNMPELVPGDGLLTNLGTEAEDLFNDNAPPTKKEEEDEILKNITDEYEIEKIKDTMDEKATVPESIFFFMAVAVNNLIIC